MDDLDLPRQLLSLGDREGAYKELMHLLQNNPRSVDAWLLLAQTLDDPKKQADCYRQVLRLDPQNDTAQVALRHLVAQPTRPTQELSPSGSVNIPEPAKQQPAQDPLPLPPTEQALPLLQPDPTPRSQAAQTSSPTPQTNQKRWGLSPRQWVFLIGLWVVVFILFCTIGGFIMSDLKRAANEKAALETKTANELAAQQSKTACTAEYIDDMTRLLSQFFRQSEIAGATARINLPAQISRLEDIRTEAWNLSSRNCEPQLHALLMDFMDKEIAAYIAFSADDDQWTDQYVESLEALAALDDRVVLQGYTGGLVRLFRERGYFYWEKLDDPNWKNNY